MTVLTKPELTSWNRELMNVFGALPIANQIEILKYRLVLLQARKKGDQQ